MIRMKISHNYRAIHGAYFGGSTAGGDLPAARGRIHVAQIPGAVNGAVNAVLAGVAKDMEAYAKENHPWQNRTGDAERGLEGYHGGYGDFGRAGETAHFAAVKHGDDVPYGIWLETAHGGRWGIIQRTLEAFKDETSRRMKTALGDLA